MIPGHLIEAVARLSKERRPAALFVRHAEREPVLDLRNHEAARLTPKGHEQAREAGALLAKASSYVRVHHSPVERCGETARGLVDGVIAAGARAELICEVPALASPFVLDRNRLDDIFVSSTSFHGFLRDWFDGKFPSDILMPRGPAALSQVKAVLEHLTHPEALHVFVSHDWNILLVREEMVGHRIEDGWPHYLDGFALTVDGDELVIQTESRTGRRKID